MISVCYLHPNSQLLYGFNFYVCVFFSFYYFVRIRENFGTYICRVSLVVKIVKWKKGHFICTFALFYGKKKKTVGSLKVGVAVV